MVDLLFLISTVVGPKFLKILQAFWRISPGKDRALRNNQCPWEIIAHATGVSYGVHVGRIGRENWLCYKGIALYIYVYICIYIYIYMRQAFQRFLHIHEILWLTSSFIHINHNRSLTCYINVFFNRISIKYAKMGRWVSIEIQTGSCLR